MSYLTLSLRCLVGVVFAVAAAGKLRGRRAFGEFLESLQPLAVVPARWRRAAAIATVGAEVVVVALLALPGAGAAGGFALAAVLLAAFAVAIRAAVRRGVRAPCRCFGASSTPLDRPHVARNACLGVAAAAGAVLAHATAPAAPHPGGVVLALASGGVLALLVTRLDDLVELFA